VGEVEEEQEEKANRIKVGREEGGRKRRSRKEKG
jgi:hypothetical protein